MIIIKILGGLGNQLFQYATAQQAAIDHKTNLLLDIGWYKHQKKRRYHLNKYPIAQDIANIFVLKLFEQSISGRAWRKIFRTYNKSFDESEYKTVSELSPNFHPDDLNLDGHLYLQGYFQNERYFNRIADDIRKTLIPINKPDRENLKYLELIDQSESVSIHVRRGDYVNDLRTNKYHGVCGKKYYDRAIEYLTRQISNPKIFVFSDDQDWAESNLEIPFQTIFLRHNNAEHAAEDLRLLSHCNHHIIANSSFSWWGAWLSKNPDKIVIAPQRWFADPEKSGDEIIPEKWIKI